MRTTLGWSAGLLGWKFAAVTDRRYSDGDGGAIAAARTCIFTTARLFCYGIYSRAPGNSRPGGSSRGDDGIRPRGAGSGSVARRVCADARSFSQVCGPQRGTPVSPGLDEVIQERDLESSAFGRRAGTSLAKVIFRSRSAFGGIRHGEVVVCPRKSGPRRFGGGL